MKTFIFGLATLAMAISTVSVPPAFAQAPAPTAVPAPQQSFEAGLYDQSLQQIAEARTRGEAGPTEAFLAAQAQLRRNDNEAARAEFAQLAAAGGDTWRLVAESSTALIDNNLDHALALAEQAVGAIAARNAAAPAPAAGPADFAAHYQLGLVKARRGDWAGAAQAFEQSAALNPTFAYAYYYAGNSWSRVRQVDRVAVNFERFLQLAPNAPERPAVMSIMRTVRGN